jgi:hypothetical protein
MTATTAFLATCDCTVPLSTIALEAQANTMLVSRLEHALQSGTIQPEPLGVALTGVHMQWVEGLPIRGSTLTLCCSPPFPPPRTPDPGCLQSLLQRQHGPWSMACSCPVLNPDSKPKSHTSALTSSFCGCSTNLEKSSLCCLTAKGDHYVACRAPYCQR